MARVFISYKRNSEPDTPVATAVYNGLRQRHDVFIDQTLSPGMRWGEQIDAELQKADFVVVFLSAAAVQSDMIRGEVERAYQLAKARPDGRPGLLPVRLTYISPLPYPLSAYLNPFQHASWSGDADTERLIAEILQALLTPGPLPESLPPRLPGGTEDWQSPLYISRRVDDDALSEIRKPNGVTISIRGSRQMGKSSLLMRVLDKARGLGKQVALLDLQFLDTATLRNADAFYRAFCALLGEVLGVEDRTDEYWSSTTGNIWRCTRYMERYLLPTLNGPFVLAIDEAERLIGADFQSDFFGMLRAWHNSRNGLDEIWQMLDIVLATSTEPHRLIDDGGRSPFNVGLRIWLNDFTEEQVTELNSRHPQPLPESDLPELMEWTGGHPYLVRQVLYQIATKQLSPSELFARAAGDDSPFRDHLEYYLFYLRHQQAWVDCFADILRGDAPTESAIVDRLEGVGLIRRWRDAVQPRCRLYADYFRTRLHG